MQMLRIVLSCFTEPCDRYEGIKALSLNNFYLSFVDNFDGNFFFVGDGVSFFHVGIRSLAYFLSNLVAVAP